MTKHGSSGEAALKNLTDELDLDSTFPESPFRTQWGVYLFFDPDLIFEAGFVEKVKAILNCEGATCACLRNLDGLRSADGVNTVYIDSETTGRTYFDELRGALPGSGLLYTMGRFGLASDGGRWCVYCERNNEVAVIAVRDVVGKDTSAVAMRQFDAVPLAQAIEKPSSHGLSSRGLPEAWRERMLQVFS